MTSTQPATNVVVTALTRALLTYGLPYLDKAADESAKPFISPDILLPQANSRWWGCTHYAIAIPGLPAPYRYINILTVIGPPGLMFTDNDYLCAPDARNTATVLSSTAYREAHHYEAYDMSTSCSFAEDGSRLAWGDDLVITNNFPEITVAGRFRHMTVDLQVVATQQASWFVRTPVYDHVCLFSTYKGTIKDDRGITPISGMCSTEYARMMTLQSLLSRPIPPSLKIPADFFTYQVIHLDKDTQLLVSDVRAAGMRAHRSAHLRARNGRVNVYQDVDFDVLCYKTDRMTDTQGRTMRVPEKMSWTVRDAGKEIMTLIACVDSPLRFGLGRGYAGAYSFTGEWQGEPVKGDDAYFEWVDCESV